MCASLPAVSPSVGNNVFVHGCRLLVDNRFTRAMMLVCSAQKEARWKELSHVRAGKPDDAVEVYAERWNALSTSSNNEQSRLLSKFPKYTWKSETSVRQKSPTRLSPYSSCCSYTVLLGYIAEPPSVEKHNVPPVPPKSGHDRVHCGHVS